MAALIRVQPGELVHHRRRVGRALLAVRAVYLEALVVQTLGGLEVAPQLRKLRLGREGRRDLERVRAEQLALHVERGREPGFALREIASIAQRIAELAQGFGNRRMTRAVNADARLQALFQQ